MTLLYGPVVLLFLFLFSLSLSISLPLWSTVLVIATGTLGSQPEIFLLFALLAYFSSCMWLCS
jgi:hypothetical protein